MIRPLMEGSRYKIAVQLRAPIVRPSTDQCLRNNWRTLREEPDAELSENDGYREMTKKDCLAAK